MSPSRILGSHRLALAALLLLGGAAPASAHDGPQGFYLGAAGGGEWQSLPSVEAVIDPNLRNIGGTDGSFWAWFAEGRLGYADGGGLTLPDPIGRNARVELRVRFTKGDSDKTVDETAPIGFIAVDNPSLGAGGTAPGQNSAFYETRLRRWDVDLLYQTDVEVLETLDVSPFVGLTYGRLVVENDFTIFENQLQFTSARVDDDLDAHFAGLVLGADLRLRPVDPLLLHLGIRTEVMGAWADLETTQVLFGPRSETDRDVDFASRSTLSTGAAVKIGWLEIGLDGFIRYLSYMPTARHPVSIPDPSSHIDDENAWSAGFTGRVTIWLP